MREGNGDELKVVVVVEFPFCSNTQQNALSSHTFFFFLFYDDDVPEDGCRSIEIYVYKHFFCHSSLQKK
jgi:hypothetical protein